MKLAKRPTRVDPLYRSKGDYKDLLEAQREALAAQQELLYADGRYSLLVVLQGMDTSGKDGVIKHVMSGVNPQGCQVHSFKHPGPEELQHDFLWRTTQHLPARGHIGIFNRSYYEEVLIVRVHPEILRSEQVPHQDGDIWQGRYRSIRAHEEHLHRNGTRVIKLFLHISKGEQRKRLLERLEDPAKRWKFNLSDLEERRYWKAYMKAYEDCLRETSTRDAPWHVVPADDKRNARLIASRLIVGALKDLDLRYPKESPKLRRSLAEIHKRLQRKR
jgi:PPK2 family polyphosphate:nucleotide phosphotransferase